MAVVLEITPRIDSLFHEDSYGYRSGKSAQDAVVKAKERCMKDYWVLDMDISRFFDTINHELLMKAIRKHVEKKWILLYIERWLKVPYQTNVRMFAFDNRSYSMFEKKFVADYQFMKVKPKGSC